MGELKWRKGMGPLDFSQFSNILLEDFEGNLQPMSEPYFKATPLAEGVWQVLSDGDYTYVIEGDDELIAIDSGNGAGYLRGFCQSLAPDKPLRRLFNTHSHGDHTMNNYQFDVVYMSEACYPNRWGKFGMFADVDVPTDYPVVFLHDGDVINLKGRPIEVYNIEEHCKGSLSFLDRKSRILFCGDELNGNFFDSRISVEHSYRNLKRWMSFRDAYDTLAAGNGVYPACFVDKYTEMAEYILNGHENEGLEYFEPSEDTVASIREKDGKKVKHRRVDFGGEDMRQRFIDAGCARFLPYNHDRFCFCFGRKMGPDGIFDRQLKKDGVRFSYYLNRIWDK